METNSRSVPCMFSTSNSKMHSALKKMISNVYSKTFISSSRAVHEQTDIIINKRLIPIIAAAADSNTPIEVVELYQSATMDMITAFLFGIRCSSNFLSDVRFRRHWLQKYHAAKKYLFWVSSSAYYKMWLLIIFSGTRTASPDAIFSHSGNTSLSSFQR